jgi:phytanoyl-CoA hydroxylase
MNKWESNFHLGEKLTQDQIDFFEKHGVIVFRNFLTPDKIAIYLEEIKRLEKTWIEEIKPYKDYVLHHSIVMHCMRF